MYDIGSRESFENLDDWIREIRQNAEVEIVIFLIGNMTDKDEELREVA